MNKEYLPIEKPTTKRSYKKIRNQLICINVFLLCTILYVETHREKPEERKLYHLWDSRGYIDNLKSIPWDEHCRTTPNKDK